MVYLVTRSTQFAFITANMTAMTQEKRPVTYLHADLLAPACVLAALNIHTPDEIMKVCDISRTSAEIRADRMKLLYERGKFGTHPLERQAIKQFEGFIQECANREKQRNGGTA